MKKYLTTLRKDLPQVISLAVYSLVCHFIYKLLFAAPPEAGQPMVYEAAVNAGMIGGMVQGTASIIQGIGGFIQAKKARKEEKKLLENRPKYKMPQEILDDQARAKNIAQGYDQARAQGERALTAQTSQAMGQASQQGGSATSQLAALAAINQSRNQAQLGLEQQSTQNQASKEARLIAANQAVVEGKDIEFDYNVNAPYQYALRKANMNLAAGKENIQKGVQGVASSGETFAGGGGGGGGMMGGGK